MLHVLHNFITISPLLESCVLARQELIGQHNRLDSKSWLRGLAGKGRVVGWLVGIRDGPEGLVDT